MTTLTEKTLKWYEDRFTREHRDAVTEFTRLAELTKEVCWYNFETRCRSWTSPWRPSLPGTTVELLGMSFERSWLRGCLMEHGHFPEWYHGPVEDAPHLPPEIVLKELRDAKAYMDACEKQASAPRDWAPGGALYEELARTTLVGRPLQTTECVYAKRRRFSSEAAP
jgi:hypothetical protein